MKMPDYLKEEALNKFIDDALREDIGRGDHSTLAVVPKNKFSKAKLISKNNGTIAGVELAIKIFRRFDSNLKITSSKNDGDKVSSGDIILMVEGPARSIISTERLVLNCMQRMSGIASYTRQLREMIQGTQAQLMDTRKTTPNFRMMEKWAVLIGGGLNHRFALYDMIMLKDNHIDLAGGIAAAIEGATKYLNDNHLNLKIEVETRTMKEVEEVVRVGGVDIIMLDNMSLKDLKKAVELIGGRFKTEASGGITESTLIEVAKTGVDYISIGALTHSVKSLDLSLKVTE